MDRNQLKTWLKELYKIDPQLAQFENQLIEIISQMKELQPETHFNADLAANIKAKLMIKINETKAEKEPKSAFSFNILKLKQSNYVYAGLAAVFVLALVAVISTNPSFLRGGDSNVNSLSRDEGSSLSYSDWLERNQDDYAQLEDQAFGSLASLSGSDEGDSRKLMGQKELVTNESVSLMSDYEVGAINRGPVISGRMMMPFNSYSYRYQGEELILDSLEGDVYLRKSINNNADGLKLAKLVSGLNLKNISLAKFNNLQADSLVLSEDSENGLTIYLDFKAGSVNIYQNWDRWRALDESCGNNDLRCLNSFKVKIEDIPSDEALIAQTNEFLLKHKIDVSTYGEPLVDNTWRQDFTKSNDQANFYIPELVRVIYPFQVAGINVRDQSGDYIGVGVNVNVLHKVVSGLDNLSLNRFELSSYPLETDAQRIIAIAEKGGLGTASMGVYSDSEPIELGLGNPEFSYVNLWRYRNGRNEELLVPTLIFPVLVDSDLEYYGQRSVIVPLVKEMLTELELEQNNPGVYFEEGELIPMPYY